MRFTFCLLTLLLLTVADCEVVTGESVLVWLVPTKDWNWSGALGISISVKRLTDEFGVENEDEAVAS